MTRVATAWSRVLVLFALVAAFAVVLAPATFVDARVSKATEDRLRLADARGLWWRGSGVVSTRDGRGRVPIAWRVDMPAMLRGALTVDFVDAARSDILGTLTTRDNVTTLRHVRGTISAASMAALDRRLDVLTIGGKVTLDAPALDFATNASTGQLRALWERAGLVVGDTSVDLGDVSLNAGAQGGRIVGTIGNAGGDVGVDGTFTIDVSAIDGAVTLRPTATASEKLRNALPTLGAADGAGGVRIAFHERR